MKTHRDRQGFTLIEVLIVVVIMAVLAATIIPQFTASTEDAKESALKFNLHTMRNQIELYKVHHSGDLPTITGTELPQLTSSTDATGTIGTGVNYPYGPYILNALPVNPYNNKNTVVAATAVPPTAEAADAGWQYDAATGQMWANTLEFINF